MRYQLGTAEERSTSIAQISAIVATKGIASAAEAIPCRVLTEMEL